MIKRYKGQFIKGQPNIFFPKGCKRPEITGEKNSTWKGGKITKQCLVCKNIFLVSLCRKYTANFCSVGCMGIFYRGKHISPKTEIKKGQCGEKSLGWKGGKIKSSSGYWIILNPKHPRANKRGYVNESILIVEKKIGRYLLPEEIVHHINRIKTDDRPENLQLFSSRNEHDSYHSKKRCKNNKMWGINKIGGRIK